MRIAASLVLAGKLAERIRAKADYVTDFQLPIHASPSRVGG